MNNISFRDEGRRYWDGKLPHRCVEEDEGKEARSIEASPQVPEYYGRTEEAVDSYCTTFQGFHPEVDAPLSEEVDERSVYIYTWNKVHLFSPHVSTWYE